MTMSAAKPPPLPPRSNAHLPGLSGRPPSEPSLIRTVTQPLPPSLPRRGASLSAEAQHSGHASDWESKFLFHSVSALPPPEEFSEGRKTYPSLQDKSKRHSTGHVRKDTSRLPPMPLAAPPPPPPR